MDLSLTIGHLIPKAPVNCFKSDIGQLGEGVGLDQLVECLHNFLVLAGIVRKSVNHLFVKTLL